MSDLHMLQPVDLKRYYSNTDGTLTYDLKKADREKHCYYHTPMDFNGYVRFLRLTKPAEQSGAATIYQPVGVTMEVDCFTFGVKVFVRMGFEDKSLKVFAEDSNGMAKLGHWTR